MQWFTASLCRIPTAVIGLVLLTGCALSTSEDEAPTLIAIVDGVVLKNRTRAVMLDAQVLVPETGAFVSCGRILPLSDCATRFPEREYRGQAVVVSWTAVHQAHEVGPIDIEVPEGMPLGSSAWIEVHLGPGGGARARLVPLAGD